MLQRRRLEKLGHRMASANLPPQYRSATTMSTPDPRIATSFATAAQRRGFSNPDQAAELARKKWGWAVIPSTSTADEMVRSLAAQRPDLLRPDWASAWSPAELAEVRDSLLGGSRADPVKREQYVAFLGQHKEALAVADGVKDIRRRELEDQRQKLSNSKWQAEQEIAKVKERRRAVEIQVNNLTKECGPFPTPVQKEMMKQRLDILESIQTEEQGLSAHVSSASAELSALPQE